MNEIERVARALEAVAHINDRELWARTAIAAMRGEPVGWQPIETAPAVGKKRLLFALARGGFAIGYRHAETKCVHIDHAAANPFTATHWMPLPTPPDSGKD